MEATIHAELRARRTFITRRGVRLAEEIGELRRDLAEAQGVAQRSPAEAQVWLMHLDYLGEAEPPWGDFQISEAIVAAVVRWPYRGVRESHPTLTRLYRLFRAREYQVWLVPFELHGGGKPAVLWTPRGAVSL
ncbi:hypothetical protein Mesil_3617 (plasmid) [Allomeiothermus silvanus DSM 9946]|uniref:Uncharacterized protein n=1 Tax=Allomeiothermus silvanus (strain ATCC 700542 / DSM 9946 / NBRC 106475 / NCIMB 13440 / VI-R2) TaxID=526227 RepID=D7BJQ1_ALLS1|nr:hypothetical protein [Allomeiothermus silvanus]ADH65407.1 hypothetical protein Mesil_3617 [Allomeiothermus silvanus DSM 9946]